MARHNEAFASIGSEQQLAPEINPSEMIGALHEWIPKDYDDRRNHLPVVDEDFYDDFTDVEETEGTEMGVHYAWLRLPRWLDDRREAINATTGTINILDLGSAFPIYSELQRSVYYYRCNRKANAITMEFITTGIGEMYGGDIPKDVGQAIRTGLHPKHGSQRAMLQGVLQSVLYKLKDGDFDDRDSTTVLTDMILYDLMTETNIYKTLFNSKNYDGRQHIDAVAVSHGKSFFDMFSEHQVQDARSQAIQRLRREFPDIMQMINQDVLDKSKHPVGTSRALEFCLDAANHLAKKIVELGLDRPFRVVSADLASPEILREDSERSFDAYTKRTGIYTRTVQNILRMRDHQQVDMLNPRFLDTVPDESLTLITIFDSFPIYFKMPEDASERDLKLYRSIVLNFMDNLGKKLKPNGRMIIFPWDVDGKSILDSKLLEDCEMALMNAGCEVTGKRKRRQDLTFWMNDMERELLQNHSAIFKAKSDRFEVLYVRKMTQSERDKHVY